VAEIRQKCPGVDKYASAEDAPADVQIAVAETAPISEWGPRTREILHAKFGPFDESQTIGQLAGEFGGGKGGGTQVASLGASDATAYASPDKPAIPPVSAAAGSSVPRADGGGSTPKGADGGAPAAAAPQQWAANGPAWAGINAALPVGSPGAPAQGQTGAAPQAPVGSAQGNYVARTGQQPPTAAMVPQAPSGGQGQPSQGGGPIIPQFPLPKGFTDQQQAILAIDQDIARLSRFGPAASGRIKALEDMRDRIGVQAAPRQLGNALFDPQTGRMLLQGPNAATARIQAMQGKADDIAEAIQSGDQPPVLTGLYGVSPLVRSKLAEDGFDLSKAQIQWDAAKKQVMSLNGPQQVRFVGLANSVVNTVDEVNDLAQQMQQGGIPLLNRVKLEAYIQTQGNSEQGQLATRYLTAVNS
jgi:hypothetical protein